jgi:hypothetical protein
MMRTIIPLIALAICLAGCSGAATLKDSISEEFTAHAAEWNPQAPSIDVLPLSEALDAAPAIEQDGRRVTALSTGNQPDLAVLAALKLESNGDAFVIRADRPFASVALHVQYDPAREHVMSAQSERDDAVSIAITRRGLVAVGVAATNSAGLNPALPLAEVRFAPGAETVLRRPAAISQMPRSAVTDLAAVWDGEGSGTLSWFERHSGDYNLDGEVGVADITPVGANFNKPVIEGNDDWAELEVVDGNENELIEVADLTPIGQSFQSFITGYNVYRTALTDPEEIPDPAADPGRWEKVLNDAQPDGPSAPRDYNGQKTRLYYTFLDTPAESGDYGWYVVPVGRTGESPLEGPFSNVATAEIGPPPVALSFEIQSPHSELLNVGTEFYIGVKVANVEGLFSANIRFEYDATLVTYVDSVAFYTDGGSNEHPNLLTPPLFVGVDVGDIPDDYREVGFNATQRMGIDDPVDGEGFLGYVKFRCISEGINEECFRFPQSSTYLYLWGENYGVPVGLPELGGPQIVNIAE